MMRESEGGREGVLDAARRKLTSLAAGATRRDAWIVGQGYRRLRSTWLPRSCQTMSEPPPQLNFSYWNREDVSLLESWIAFRAERIGDDQAEQVEVEVDDVQEEDDQEEDDEERMSELERWVEGRPAGEGEGEGSPFDEDSDDLFDEDVAMEDGPTIVMDDDFIEIRYDGVPSKGDGRSQVNKNKMADCRALSPRRAGCYRDFLVKSDRENINEDDDEGGVCDVHRVLTQTLSPRVVVDDDNRVRPASRLPDPLRRTGSFRDGVSSSSSEAVPARSFLSFRRPKRSRTKRPTVVGGQGVPGPVWPAVLLTFDRGISPTPPDAN